MLYLDQGRNGTANDSPPPVSRGCIPQGNLALQNQTDLERVPLPASVNLGVHWLRGSIPHAEQTALLDFLDNWFGPHEFREYGRSFYDRSYWWSNSVSLLIQSTARRYADLTNGKMTLEVPGSTFDAMGIAKAAEFIKRLYRQHTFKASRLDIYADDLERVIVPHELYGLVYEEDYLDSFEIVTKGTSQRLRRRPRKRDFVHFETVSYRTINDAHDGCRYDEVAFGTRGSKGSGKYLRVYDKWLETAGEIPAVRWELELSDKRAANVAAKLCETATLEWGQCIGTMITASIDFRKRGSDIACKNVSRCERYAFWENLLERIGTPDKTALALAVEPKSIPKSFDFIARQAMGSLQTCYVAAGRAPFLHWLLEAIQTEDRLDQAAWSRIEEYREHLRQTGDPGIAAMHDWFAERGIDFDPDYGTPDGYDGQEG